MLIRFTLSAFELQLAWWIFKFRRLLNILDQIFTIKKMVRENYS